MSTKPARRGHPLNPDEATPYRAIREQVTGELPELSGRPGEGAGADALRAAETAPDGSLRASDGEAVGRPNFG